MTPRSVSRLIELPAVVSYFSEKLSDTTTARSPTASAKACRPSAGDLNSSVLCSRSTSNRPDPTMNSESPYGTSIPRNPSTATTAGWAVIASSTAAGTVARSPTGDWRAAATNRSACSVCPTQYTTVSRKLPIMIAMATIIARLTARAATEMDARRTAPPRFVRASSTSTDPSRVGGREPAARYTGRAAPVARHRIRQRRPQASRTPAGRPPVDESHTSPPPETALPTRQDSVRAVERAGPAWLSFRTAASGASRAASRPERSRRRWPEAGQSQMPVPRSRCPAVEPWRRSPPRTCSPSTRSAARPPAPATNPAGPQACTPRTARLTASPREQRQDRPA